MQELVDLIDFLYRTQTSETFCHSMGYLIKVLRKMSNHDPN